MPNPIDEIFSRMDEEQNDKLQAVFTALDQEQQVHLQKIQEPPKEPKNKRFLVQFKLPESVDKTIGPILRGINRAAEFTQEALHLDPRLTERLYGGHTETGSPIADIASEMGGQIAGSLPLMGATSALTGRLLGAVGRAAPSVASALSKAPEAVRVLGRAAAPGATYWAAKEALSPEYAKPGLERLPEELAFWGGAGTAGKYAAEALGVLPRMVSAPLVGATEAVGGGLAAYPFAEERGPEYFKAMGPQAIAMGLLRTAGALGEKEVPARAAKELPPVPEEVPPAFVKPEVTPPVEVKPLVKEEIPPEAPPFIKRTEAAETKTVPEEAKAPPPKPVKKAKPKAKEEIPETPPSIKEEVKAEAKPSFQVGDQVAWRWKTPKNGVVKNVGEISLTVDTGKGLVSVPFGEKTLRKVEEPVEKAKPEPEAKAATPPEELQKVETPQEQPKYTDEYFRAQHQIETIGAEKVSPEILAKYPDLNPTNKYFISRELKATYAKDYSTKTTKTFTEVKGKPVKIPGFEEFDFFIHRSGNSKTSGWTLSEGRTGKSIDMGATQKEAIENAKALLEKAGPQKTKELINKIVKEEGESPRYTYRENIPAEKLPKKKPPFIKEVQGMPAQQKAVSPPETGEVSPVQKADVNAYIEREFLMPLRSKRLTLKGVAGEYKTRQEVARTKRPFDIDTAAHELGHHLTKVLRLKATDYPEIYELGKAIYPDKPKVHGTEGLAEFFRRYFVNPAEAQKKAPKFYADFTERLGREPELRKKITELQDLYQGWYKQNAVDYFKGLVVKEEPKAERDFLTKGQQAYTEWVDDLHPIYRAMETLSHRLRSETDLPIQQNPYVLARLAKASSRAAEALLTRASVGPDLKVNGKSYREILEPVRDRLDDFRAYIIAKRVLEREGLGKRSGFDPVKAQEVVNRLDSPEFRKAAEERQQYRNNLLDWLVDSGVISTEQAGILKEMQKDYVPFYRYFGEGQSPVRGKGTGYTKASQPIKRMRDIEARQGAEQPIIDPIESDIRDTFLFMRIAKQNYAKESLVNLAKKAEGKGWLVEELPTPVEVNKVELERLKDDLIKAGVPEEALEGADLSQVAVLFNARKFATGKEAAENIIPIRVRGEVKFYQLHPELYKAFQGLDNYEANFLLTTLGRITSVLKVGVLSSPDFWVRNVARDTGNRLLVTKGSVWEIPKALIKGFYHAAKKTDKYVEAEVAGALQASQVSLSRERMQEYVKRLTGSKETKDFIKDIATSPIRFITNLLELSDEASRMAEYLTTEGKSKEAKQWAAYHARESSLDYLRAGTKGREMNKAVAFFNASIQGPDKLAREFRRDPGKMLARGALLGMLGAYVYFLNHRNKEIAKRYDEEPRWRKDLYWVLYRKDGTPVYLPKPFEGGMIFSSSVERTLDYLRKKDPKVYQDLAASNLEVMTPGIVPTAFMAALEWWANKSFFTGRPIVPTAEQRLPEQFQYGPQTSETAKTVGKLLKVSPRKVEAAVRGYTGTVGMHALDLVDAMAGKALEKKTAEQLIPGAKAFTGEPLSSSASVDEFYNELSRLEKEDAAADKKLRQPLSSEEQFEFSRLKFYKKLIDPLRKQLQQIQNNPNLNPIQKRQRIREINKQIVNKAREALGREPLK